MTYVEELARALLVVHYPQSKWDDVGLLHKQIYQKLASDTITAIAALAARGGPKLVRRGITDDMRSAHETAPHAELQPCFSWSSMFDAAPAVPEEASADA